MSVMAVIPRFLVKAKKIETRITCEIKDTIQGDGVLFCMGIPPAVPVAAGSNHSDGTDISVLHVRGDPLNRYKMLFFSSKLRKRVRL